MYRSFQILIKIATFNQKRKIMRKDFRKLSYFPETRSAIPVQNEGNNYLFFHKITRKPTTLHSNPL